ncbi:MAG: FixH family protein, partial [Pseudomonas sp.]
MQHDNDIPPWYKQFWPWFLISILVFAVVIGMGLLYVSLLNPDSMVRDNYYKEGRAINMHLGRDHLARELE